MAAHTKYLDLDQMPAIIELFLQSGKLRKFRRKELFIKEGQKHGFIGFVREGGFRHLIRTPDGREQIVGYSFSGDFVASYHALHMDSPSVVTIQAIRNSSVFMLEREEFMSLQSCEFRIKVAEIVIDELYNRLISACRDTMEERYLNIVARHPAILEEVPLKEIASFIGITPETLSRIRKKISLCQNS